MKKTPCIIIATKYAGTDFHILIFERKDVGIMLSLMEGSGFCESGRHRHLLLLLMMMIMTMMTITMMMMTMMMMMSQDRHTPAVSLTAMGLLGF